MKMNAAKRIYVCINIYDKLVNLVRWKQSFYANESINNFLLLCCWAYKNIPTLKSIYKHIYIFSVFAVSIFYI